MVCPECGEDVEDWCADCGTCQGCCSCFPDDVLDDADEPDSGYWDAGE